MPARQEQHTLEAGTVRDGEMGFYSLAFLHVAAWMKNGPDAMADAPQCFAYRMSGSVFSRRGGHGHGIMWRRGRRSRKRRLEGRRWRRCDPRGGLTGDITWFNEADKSGQQNHLD
jgi:hypothetical protein